MRNIKYRVWDQRYRKMEYLEDWRFLSPWMTDTERPIFMQYTGLKDKEGKEIYEGDIIKCITKQHGWPHKGKVEYVEPSFKINVGKEPSIREGEENDYYTDFYNNENFEIIGNIYENPELIKQ